MTEDEELEQLKSKRLKEMQKNLSLKQKQDEVKSKKENQTKKAPSARQILVSRLGYRGLEVLENAEFQFPKETMMIIEKLVELIQSDDLTEKIDGGQLLTLFRSLGMNVRVKTTINVQQDGKFVSLSEKLKTSKSDTQSTPSDSSDSS